MGDGLKRAMVAARCSRILNEVKIGQVWADNDWRQEGRTVEVLKILGMYALCRVLTGRTPRVNNGYVYTPKPNAETKIRLDRFRPNSTGFKLVKDVP